MGKETYETPVVGGDIGVWQKVRRSKTNVLPLCHATNRSVATGFGRHGMPPPASNPDP